MEVRCRADLDVVAKKKALLLPQDLTPVVQPVASRITDQCAVTLSTLASVRFMDYFRDVSWSSLNDKCRSSSTNFPRNTLNHFLKHRELRHRLVVGIPVHESHLHVHE
jgi:hypothetical protein